MTIEVKVPTLPESVADGLLVEWHKKPGDAVEEGENIVDIETDKVVLECPAPKSGVLSDIVVEVGTTVTSGQLIAKIDENGSVAAAPAEKSAESASDSDDADSGSEQSLSPAVRRVVDEHGIDPSQVTGTGKDGRLTKKDVLAFVESGGAKKGDAAPAKAAESAPATTSKAADEEINLPSGERVEQRVPMTRLRQRIAERLVEAQQSAAMLTTFNEINMQPVMDLRKKYQDQFVKGNDVKLGFMSFFVKACIEGLKRYPAVNASIDGTDIIYHGYYDLGIAVSSPRGLVVPVVRDADQQSFGDVEKSIRALGAKAQEGKLSMDELTGGTFSITNGGIFGSWLSTPILNPPQSGILGMHAINDKPIVENGEVVIRPVMMVALSYDHRIIDGKEAVSFLRTVKECIEEPARLLLQV